MTEVRVFKVNLAAFAAAVGKLPAMKRGPSGGRGKIPKDTVLTWTLFGLSVDTPAIRTELTGQGTGLGGPVSVDARQLHAVCSKWAAHWKHAPDTTLLVAAGNGMLHLRVGESGVRIKLLSAATPRQADLFDPP